MYINTECPSVYQIEYIAVISCTLNLTKPVNLTKTEAQSWLRRYADMYRQVQNAHNRKDRPNEVRYKIRALLMDGRSKKEICQTLKISESTYYKYK